MNCRNLIIIFGDQLSESVSSLQNINKQSDRVLMMEVMSEATYVQHHKQKLVFIFSAMRHFANLLRNKGITVDYIELTSSQSYGSFYKTLKKYLQHTSAKKIVLTEPSEYRVLHDIHSNWKFGVDIEIKTDDRFYCSKDTFKRYAKQHPSLRMEYFYRYLRKKTGILMHNNKPVGGEWNYDKQNREMYDKQTSIPKEINFSIDEITREVIDLVKKKFANNFGNISKFNWAVTRRSALRQLNCFIDNCLPWFGRFQDAMVSGEYRLFHSILSPYINIGLITAKEVVERIEAAYYKNDGLPINAVEGVIRQILGWREYVRGIYWLKMPDYDKNNFLNVSNPLPDFYWNADTKMACMKHVIQQTIDIAHSHHIQRLMVTGNFALLAGIDIKSVCEWYLAVYIDAYDWVELPNTLGMVCYADGGLMASKPYAASGNYINKMSDFCKKCHYNVKQKTGDKACPFNVLYWYFLIRNQSKLENNKRMTYPYATLNKMDKTLKKKIEKQATSYIQTFISS